MASICRSALASALHAGQSSRVFVRYEAAVASPSGRHPGLFALANRLASEGLLTPHEHVLWRASNDWFQAAHQDPAVVDPAIFDRAIHPMTSCWFKVTAGEILNRVQSHLRLLDAHGVAWREVRSEAPGVVIYEDAVQIVVC